MKVLLVSANTETINMPVLPLGLSCIARAVRDAGHRAMIVNTLEQGPADTGNGSGHGHLFPGCHRHIGAKHR